MSDEIKQQIHDTYSSWADLRQILKDRDEQLDQSGHLQRFIRDLDDFEKWMHSKMNEIVNEETPQTEADARQVQIRLNLIKGEIDNYEEQYATLKKTGQELTEGQDNPEYKQFRQRLEAADKGTSTDLRPFSLRIQFKKFFSRRVKQVGLITMAFQVSVNWQVWMMYQDWSLLITRSVKYGLTWVVIGLVFGHLHVEEFLQ